MGAFYYLPLEYWLLRILFEIVGAIVSCDTYINWWDYYESFIWSIYTSTSRYHQFDWNSSWFFTGIKRKICIWDWQIVWKISLITFVSLAILLVIHQIICKKDPSNKISQEIVATKKDPAKQYNNNTTLSINGMCCNKDVADEYPIILDIIRSKKVAPSLLVGDVANLEEEPSASISVGTVLLQMLFIPLRWLIYKEKADIATYFMICELLVVTPWQT